MRVTSRDVQAAGQCKRWAIRRWGLVGAFGSIGYPTRKGRPRGELDFTQAHVERARFIAAAMKARVPLHEIGALEPDAWARAGALAYPTTWTTEDVHAVLAVKAELDKGRALKNVARARKRAIKRAAKERGRR